MVLRIIVTSLFLGLASCAGLLEGLSQGPLTPGQAGSIGAVSGAAAVKVKQDLKEISTVKPTVHIKPLQVCFKTVPLGPDKIQCILSPCKTNCSKVLDVSVVDFQRSVLIPEEMWVEFAGEIKAACTSPLEEYKELCEMHYINYDNLDAVVIFNDSE